MSSNKENACEEILSEGIKLSEIENSTNDQILDTAQAFYEAALCFDRLGERIQSAKYFTLSGEFYLNIEDEDKAAECYGKAILRNLMANELEAADILLKKGEKNEAFDTFHFRMAKDTFSRRIADELDLLEEKVSDQQLFDSSNLDEDLVDISDDSFDIKLEEIDIEFDVRAAFNIESQNADEMATGNTVVSSVKVFNLIEQETTEIDSNFSERIARFLISKSRPKSKYTIESISSARFGENNIMHDLGTTTSIYRKDTKQLIGSDLEITDFDEITDKEFASGLENTNDITKTPTNDNKTKLRSDDHMTISSFLPTSSIEKLLTLEADFVSISEIHNEFDEDLEDVEIHDAIPLEWEIKNITNASNFELLAKDVDRETGNLIFTWKKSNLKKGETASIEYTLRRRLHRNILMNTKDQIFLINSYHSVEEISDNQLEITVEFENVQKKPLEFVLIEDTIPQEFQVIGFSPKDNPPVQYQTKEGLLYRWTIENFKPKEKISIHYKLRERPFTRWFENNFEFVEDGKSKRMIVEKIAEPVIDILDNQYLLFYELKPEANFDPGQFILKDEIPQHAELMATYPVFFRPTIEEKNNKRFLSWYNIKLQGKHRKICVRLKTKNPYNPQEPILEFENYSIERQKKEEERVNELIDLRKKMGFAVIKRVNAPEIKDK